MRKRIAAVVAATWLLAGCDRSPNPSSATTHAAKNESTSTSGTPPIYVEPESNLLSLGSGIVVVDRTGEDTLTTSALQAFDSAGDTQWNSPTEDVQQSATIELPALTRIEKFGVNNAVVPFAQCPKEVLVESSTDGAHFATLTTAHTKANADGQLFDVPPAETRFLRVTVKSVYGDQDSSFGVTGFEARGRRVGPVTTPDVSGEWQINEKHAILRQEGRNVEGVLFSATPMPVYISGDIAGNLIRFTWTRVNQAGFGIMTVNPESTRLNALFWYEQPITLFAGDSWFGERRSRNSGFAPLPLEKRIRVFLGVSQNFPTYQVRFDANNQISGNDSVATLNALRDFVAANPQARFRINAQYFGAGSHDANHRVTDARAAAIRNLLSSSKGLPPNLEIASIGGDVERDPPQSQVTRPLYDRVELQVLGPSSQ